MVKTHVAWLLTAVALAGCTKASEKGGTAGNETFRVVVPAVATQLNAGETKTVQVSLDRGAGFHQAVRFTVRPPAGLTVDVAEFTVQPADKGEVQMSVTAAVDAPLGDHVVPVSAKPDKGEIVETQFKVTVSAK